MEYKIVEQKHYDIYGKISNFRDNPSYYIKQQKTFLGFKYWKYIRYEKYDIIRSYKTRIYFKTLEEAQTFVKDVLCPNKPRDKWVITDIQTYKCK